MGYVAGGPNEIDDWPLIVVGDGVPLDGDLAIVQASDLGLLRFFLKQHQTRRETIKSPSTPSTVPTAMNDLRPDPAAGALDGVVEGIGEVDDPTDPVDKVGGLGGDVEVDDGAGLEPTPLSTTVYLRKF
jgi:hypothetical protein